MADLFQQKIGKIKLAVTDARHYKYEFSHQLTAVKDTLAQITVL